MIDKVYFGKDTVEKIIWRGSLVFTDDRWRPSDLFKNGEKGFLYEPYDLSNLYQDSSMTTRVEKDGDPVGVVRDSSGNNVDAIQAVSSKRMVYKESPSRLFLDKLDDDYRIVVPQSGWKGTLVLATQSGTSSYDVEMVGGNRYTIGGATFPSNSINGLMVRNGDLTPPEKEKIETYFEKRGAVRSFSNTTNLYGAWMNWSYLTSFPMIDTSNVTALDNAWLNCGLLKSFPPLDFTNVKSAPQAWYLCKQLVDFPEHMFDHIKGGNLIAAFNQTNLSQKSIDGILVSLVASGVASGQRFFSQSGGSEPSEVGKRAVDTLRQRGWTVTVTGGY